jgi:hypothetical protein
LVVVDHGPLFVVMDLLLDPVVVPRVFVVVSDEFGFVVLESASG